MPTGPVGSQTIPVPAGPNGSPLYDPSLDGLLAYAAHWLNVSLDPKLGNLGTSANKRPTCAVPADSRFPVNPLKTYVRKAKPALYAWESAARGRQFTLVHDVLDRDITMLYVFAEIAVPCGDLPWSGLPDAISRIFTKAASRRRHPTFKYPGAPIGHALGLTMNWLNWAFLGGEGQLLEALPGSAGGAAGATSDTHEQRVVMAYLARWTLTELVEPDTDGRRANERGVFDIEAGETAPLTEQLMTRTVTDDD